MTVKPFPVEETKNFTQVKNFTQTVKFSAQTLIHSKMTEELNKALSEYLDAAKDSDDVSAGVYEAAVAAVPEEMKAELDQLGVSLPTDPVEVKMDFGSFLFDAYTASATPPTAPLAKASYQKRLQDLAVAVQKNRFSLDQEYLSSIRATLENDSVWQGALFSVYIGEDPNAEDTSHLRLTAQGASFYNQVLEEAVKLFEGTNDAEESDVQEEVGADPDQSGQQ